MSQLNHGERIELQLMEVELVAVILSLDAMVESGMRIMPQLPGPAAAGVTDLAELANRLVPLLPAKGQGVMKFLRQSQ